MFQAAREYRPVTSMFIIHMILIGAVVGVLMWLTTWLVQGYLIEQVICRGGECQINESWGIVTALVLGHFVGLILLIKADVFRPLLVVMLSLLTLWGFHIWLAPFAWWQEVIYTSILVGLAYALYAWINRALSFPFALAVSIVVLIAARFMIAL